MMDMSTMNALGDIYTSYHEYARDAEMKGKKPVSILRFALGNF